MDLGIKGKWALVCGASKGLGLGCAQALVQEGVNVLIVARGLEVLQDAANKMIAGQAIQTLLTSQIRSKNHSPVPVRVAAPCPLAAPTTQPAFCWATWRLLKHFQPKTTACCVNYPRHMALFLLGWKVSFMNTGRSPGWPCAKVCVITKAKTWRFG